MSDLQSENTKDLQFIPNISRVIKTSKNDKLYIMGALFTLNVFFLTIEIYAKIILIIAALVFGFLKVLSLIYNSNILKNPISINSETKVLSYFDEFSIKRKSVNLSNVKSIRFFIKNNNPYIFEINSLVDDKPIEENINLEAFDNWVIKHLINTIEEIDPEIKIEIKNLENKRSKKY